jgi:hypothetical protein
VFHLLDYLSFYPLIDTDDPDPQIMDNTQPLPRYASGRIVLIVTAPLALTAPITITYTNESGVSGRTATSNLIPGLAIGVCATGAGTGVGTGAQATPFFPLASGDQGVSLIESVQMGGSAGGFVCAVIVKPIATLTDYETGVAAEREFSTFGSMPEVKEGACLNFMIQRGGTATGNYRGELIFVNS